MPITHTKVSPFANQGSNSLVQPSDWNANHTIAGVLDLTTASSVLGVALAFIGVPTGSCSSTQLAVNVNNGSLYSCVSGTWSAVGLPLPAGDLGGSVSAPTVVSTHLAAPLPINQGGTGTTTPALVAGSNVTITGAWPNQTINAAGSVASVTLTAQTASIATTTLYAVPGGGAGMYVVYVDTICTVAGSGGTVTVNIGWNNGVTSAGLNTANFSLTSQGEQAAQIGNFYSTASQNITYATTVAGATGSPQYQLAIRLAYLG